MKAKISYREFDYEIIGECWEVRNTFVSKSGYPMASFDNKPMCLHRALAMFNIEKRKLKSDECILHFCNNKLCINPDHLKIGTHKENSENAVSDGLYGKNNKERNGNSKLTEQDVKLIRLYFHLGLKTQKELSYEFNTSQPNISNIIYNKRWRY